MTSFGATSFAFGSAVSATGSAVSDAFESYRRAQYLFAGSAVANSETSGLEDEDDEESGFRRRTVIDGSDGEDEDEEEYRVMRHGRPREDSFVTPFEWDEDQDNPHTPVVEYPRFSPRHPDSYVRTGRRPSRVEQHRDEEAPLLPRKASVAFSVEERPRVARESGVQSYGTRLSEEAAVLLAPPGQTLNRKSSTLSHKSSKSVHYAYVGRSTYGQTLFNSIAILLGIGMLSEPLAFAYAGWFMGTILIISYAYISCYTAKILAKMILSDPRLRSYSDIGRKAFGPQATIFISFMFCMELFAVTVILVTLYGDSIHTIIPRFTVNEYKMWILVILIPSVFMPLSLLSYTSIVGILSTVVLVLVIFIDGFSKKEAPGSLLSPAPTYIGFQDFQKLGVAFGLFMAGFSGHPVIPSLARDMIDPTQFDGMIDWAFLVATAIYTAIGAAGYLMFGNDVHDEISIDLLITPGYNPIFNEICLWLLVVSPISKFGLNAQPLNTTIEILLGLDTSTFTPEDIAAKPNEMSSITPAGRKIKLKKFLAVLQRIGMTVLAVVVSIAVPEFSSMMAFLGSFSAFMMAVVGPILAKVMIERRCGWFDGIVMGLGIATAIWGTAAAFWSSS